MRSGQTSRAKAGTSRSGGVTWICALALLAAALGASQAEAQTCAPGDTTPPVLSITAPLRSAAITQGGVADDLVVVDGTAIDAESDVVAVTINGLPAIVQLDGSFAESTTSHWGMNRLVITATDACGRTARVVQAYLRGGDYYPAATTIDPAAAIASGFETRLNQPVIDDGDRGSFDDLATIFEGALPPLTASDLPNPLQAQNNPACSGLLDNWVTNQQRIRIVRTSFSASALEVESLDGEPGLLAGVGRMDSFVLGIRATAYSCVAGTLQTVVRDGTLSASGTQIDFDLVPSVVNGEVELAIENVNVSSTIQFSISCTLQVICDAITNRLTPTVEDLVLDGIRDKLSSQEATIAVSALLDEALPGSAPYTLPPPIGLTVDIASEVDSVTNITDAMTLGARTQVFPSSRGASIPAAAPGSIRRDGAATPFELVPYELGYALRDDMLNQFLWAIWYEGGYAMPDLSSEPDVPLDFLSLDAGLPPVLRPAGPGTVEIGRGDVAFSLSGDLAELYPPLVGPISASGVYSSKVRGTIGVDASGTRLEFLPEPGAVNVVEAELTSVSGVVPAFLLRPVLEGRLAELEIEFARRSIAEFVIPRIPSQPLGGPTGYELVISNALSDRPTDDAVRVTGDLVEVPICGDGLVLVGEVCDDGAELDGDGCSATCEVEAGWVCVSEPSVCTFLCGNGGLDVGETCDDGGLVNGDGCSDTCLLQSSITIAGTAVGGFPGGLVVEGVLIELTTETDEPGVAFALRLAQAINSDPTLSSFAPPVEAVVEGSRLHVTGSVTSVAITDPGLTDSVPALPALGALGRLVLMLGLGAGAVRGLRWRGQSLRSFGRAR